MRKLKIVFNSYFLSFGFLMMSQFYFLHLAWPASDAPSTPLSKTNSELNKEIDKIDKSIELTKVKMREMKDLTFVPDLYFMLGEFYTEKSRYLYTLKRQENQNQPISEIDFSSSIRVKKQAIETYQRFVENFPKDKNVDKAIFFMAHQYHELGQFEEMIKNYQIVIKSHPKSLYWEESNIIIGNYYVDIKKDPVSALEFYMKVLNRPVNPFMPIARYKIGWCYINQNKFEEAFNSFEGVLTLDTNVSLELLPDIYKKTDIRRDALLAMVWPYSELKKVPPTKTPALNYFQKLIPDRPSLLAVLPKLAKRMLVKNKVDEVVPIYIQLIKEAYDLGLLMESIDGFYESLKKSKIDWDLIGISDVIANTLIRVRFSSDIEPGEIKRTEKNYEIYLRDVITRLDKKYKMNKKNEIAQAAIEGYNSYLSVYPNSNYVIAMGVNLAELYYQLKQYSRAGYFYEKAGLASKSKTKKKEYLDSTIESYSKALKVSEKLSRLELTEAREGFREIGQLFMTAYPKDPANPMILFNIARTYFDERIFDKAILNFNNFVAYYPWHKEAPTAGQLILDSFNQKEDYEGLIAAGKNLINNAKINNPQFKKDIQEIIRQAEYRKLQDQVGDPNSRDYAKKLLSFATKYKGTSLGDQALYEAFISLKAKKDLSAYEPGEELLLKHEDSKYAKEVVSAMGQMAMNTADYRRSSKYYEIFARKFPKDSVSRDLLKTAAQTRELMGDFKEAAEDYRDIGMKQMVSKQYIMSRDWVAASQSLSSSVTDAITNYWMGLSLFRLSQFEASRPYLNNVQSGQKNTHEEKTMAAHSIYLLASMKLKEYQKIQLGQSNDEAALVKSKMQLLAATTKDMNDVIGFQNGKWTIAALYELGKAHDEFAQFLSLSQPPAQLSESQITEYRNLIIQQANQYRGKAGHYFQTCKESAEKYEVFTHFVKGCISNGTEVIDESLEDRIYKKATDIYPVEALSVRKKLFDAPKSPELLMALSEIYVKNQDYSMARLVLNRVLEIKPKWVLPMSWIGVTYLYENDFEMAGAQFKQTLQMFPKDGISLMGLAALYKNFGYTKKYLEIKVKLKSVNIKNKKNLHPWMLSL